MSATKSKTQPARGSPSRERNFADFIAVVQSTDLCNYREVNEPKLFELFVNASGAIRATAW
jgi:hypothetical protein